MTRQKMYVFAVSQYLIKGCGVVPDEEVSPWDPNSLLRAAFAYSTVLAGVLAVLLTAGIILLYKRYIRHQLALLQVRMIGMGACICTG
jgi:hypothetical protein